MKDDILCNKPIMSKVLTVHASVENVSALTQINKQTEQHLQQINSIFFPST